MFQPEHGSWRQKFGQFNVRVMLYCSWVLGLIPYAYNGSGKRRKVKRSTWLIGYGIILNCILVWMAYSNYGAAESEAKLSLYRRNPLARQINILHNGLLLLTVAVMYLRTWWLSDELATILNMLLGLHKESLLQHDTRDCHKFDNYVIYKGSTIFLEVASMIVLEIGLSPEYSISMLTGIMSLLIIQCGVLMVSMHFHVGVMYIYRSMWLINRELLEMVHQLRRSEQIQCRRVHKLHGIYSRLLMINDRLVAAYDYQTTLVMISLLGVNIISIFYMIVYSVSMRKPLTMMLLLNFGQALFVNVSDFWLNVAVCELATRANRGTLKILKLFNEITGLTPSVERSLSDLALFCSHRRIVFNHCGLFTVDNSMGFRMIITSVLYLVYLVQFDYMNL